MNKRKFFLLPICLLLLGACNMNNAPESKESQKASEPEISSIEDVSSEEQKSSEEQASSEEQGTSSEAHVHEFGEWKTSRLPTCTEKGQEKRTCACGEFETRETNALGHLWDDGEMTTRPTAEAAGEKTFHCQRSGCNATKTEPIEKVTGYTVTFNQGEHFKVKVYKTQDYTNETPVETYSCLARDKYGNAVEYDPADALDQPQINFKVEVDSGYKVGYANVQIEGTYKNFKAGPSESEGLPEGFFRATKIQTNLKITITPVVDTGEEEHGFEAKFITNHCQVVVYKGQTVSDENIDTEDHYYSRAKNGDYVLDATGQINFKVIPDAGYKWNPGVEDEAAVSTFPFISGSATNLKYVSPNVYRITKVASDIDILVNCIPEAGEAGLGYEITFVTEHCHVLVYETQDYQFTPVAPVDGKVLSRTEEGSAAKYVAEVAGVDANGDGDYDDEGDTAPVAEVKPQVNFVVVCDDGYEFVSGVTFDNKNEAKASAVPFITGSYNKLKNMGNNIYRATKIQGNLTITLTATAVAA